MDKYICLKIMFMIFAICRISGVCSSATFTFVNNCESTVWPGVLSNAGIAPLSTTGFALRRGESRIINAPSSWGGRFWGRTNCTVDSAGKFSCVTGDCRTGKMECAGGTATPPATLAEFTLGGGSLGIDFFDVSLVDGYNLPLLVVPQGGLGVNCTSTGCVGDFNGACPSDLRVISANGERVACRSACDAFQKDEYCCIGAYGSPQTCLPTRYSQIFKNACPQAYSYAYDDKSSTFTCSGGADYTISFCPSPSTSKKSSSDGEHPESGPSSDSIINSSMVYEGAVDISRSPPCTCLHFFCGATTAVALAALMWPLRHPL